MTLDVYTTQNYVGKSHIKSISPDMFDKPAYEMHKSNVSVCRRV